MTGSVRGSGASVVLHADTVVKVQDARAAALECDRTRRGAVVAATTGDFVVPAILEHDVEAGRLVFERLHDLLRLDHPPCPADAFQQAGLALGRIHASSPVPCCGAVFSHGDYGLDNVLWSPTRGIVVIDWADAAWAQPGCVDHCRPAVVDLGIFLVGLFYHGKLRDPARSWRVGAADGFLRGYRQAGCIVDRDALLDSVDRLADCKQRGRSTWLGRLLHMPSIQAMHRHLGRAPRRQGPPLPVRR